jgi:glycosyltransferase involved in cell wall biosynthesis
VNRGSVGRQPRPVCVGEERVDLETPRFRTPAIPTVSVVVPNYNHARFLRRRIDSILEQSFQDFELIILDDCSTDESRSIIASYSDNPRVKIELNRVNSGNPFKQWNKGVALATGPYVWIAESDDYAAAEFLETLVPKLDAFSNLQFVYCRSWRVSEDDILDGFADTHFPGADPTRWTADFCADGLEECRKSMVRGCIVQNASAVLFRKAAYDRSGGADEELELCGDWKLWASLMLLGDFGYVAKPLNHFRFHSASVRSNADATKRDVAQWLRVVAWILEHVTPPDEVLREVRRYQANRWVPVLLSPRIPLHVKLDTLRCARAIDPHPIRSMAYPLLTTIQRKFLRHWRNIGHKEHRSG